MEVSSIAADAVESREVETGRRSWKAILPKIVSCPVGQAVIVNLGAVSDKAVKQARWNLRSACKNDIECDNPTLSGMPEVLIGKTPGTLIVKPFVAPIPAAPTPAGKGGK